MNQQVDYKKVGTYYTFGNIFNTGISFITVPIFTRILETSDYGMVTTFSSWVAIVSMALGFALHMGVRASFIDYEDDTDSYLSVTCFFTIVSSILITAIILLGAILLKADVSLYLIVLCLFQSFASAIINDYSMYLMMKYQYKCRTVLMILPNLLSIIVSVCTILFILHSDFYLGRIVPFALITFAFSLVILIKVFRFSPVIVNATYLKHGLAISAPLILHGIALNILSQSDRTMITALADASQTGIYSLTYNFSSLATVITTALDGVWVPWFTRKLKERRIDDINCLTVDYVNLMTYAIIGLVLTGPEIVKLLASEKYWEGIKIIPPLVLANYIIFSYTIYVNIEHYYKKTVYISINTLIAAGVNIVTNFWFIPIYGYIAAAYTTLFSYFISFILHSAYAKKLESDLYPLKIFFRPLLHIFSAVVIFYKLIDNGSLRWMILVIYLIAMAFRERKRILFFFPQAEVVVNKVVYKKKK